MWAGDADGQSLRWLGLGHPPLLLRRGSTGQVEWHESEGMPLGMFPQPPWRGNKVVMAPDDLLLCLTDGLWECHTRHHDRQHL